MYKLIIIGQALIILALAIIIICQRVKHVREYTELAIMYEDECTLRKVENACGKIFLEHYKADKEKEIKLLREALNGSEAKRKELCTRLWEEEKLK